MDRFQLEGIVYYQQSRKCGKKGCRCANGGPLHGPYWYTRNVNSGKIKYIGKSLPSKIIITRENHQILLSAMTAEMHILTDQLDALRRLRHNASLSEKDKALIKGLGFDAALVSSPPDAGTQENPK